MTDTDLGRNPTATGDIRASTGAARERCEDSQASLLRGMSGPEPKQPVGAARPPRAAPTTGHRNTPARSAPTVASDGLRNCPKCGDRFPLEDFPLLRDPRHASYATRMWHGGCLVTGRHITAASWARHQAAVAADHAARVAVAVRENAMVDELEVRALTDPGFARALLRAAGLPQVVRVARAENARRTVR